MTCILETVDFEHVYVVLGIRCKLVARDVIRMGRRWISLWLAFLSGVSASPDAPLFLYYSSAREDAVVYATEKNLNSVTSDYKLIRNCTQARNKYDYLLFDLTDIDSSIKNTEVSSRKSSIAFDSFREHPVYV